MIVLRFFQEFFGNYMLICGICGWLFAQIMKMFTGLFSGRRFNFVNLLFSHGGMPSSHSATVLALATAALLEYGVNSSTFAITAILSFIVMTDATGVRYQTGEQSKILNRMVKEIFPDVDEDNPPPELKELVGHTPFQVTMGALLGVAIGVVLGFAMGVISL